MLKKENLYDERKGCETGKKEIAMGSVKNAVNRSTLSSCMSLKYLNLSRNTWRKKGK